VSEPGRGDGPAAGDARAEVLGRIRRALADAPPGSAAALAAGGGATAAPASHGPAPLSSQAPEALRHGSPPPAPTSAADRFAERVEDYRARVHSASADTVADVVAEICEHHGARRLAVPAGLDPAWVPEAVEPVPIGAVGPDEIAALDAVDGVLTACALAIAETGTIVLDAGPGQGPRAATLLPDLHVCVVQTGQIVPGVADAVAALHATVAGERRPLTWISGPSATSDIELDRVEGVHGPRRLEVVLVFA
jgi:L-lactate dehydrogenase complex protein LldG